MTFRIKTISESLQFLIDGFIAAFEFAKERTPTQEDRIAEAIFIEHINRYRLICCEDHTIIETAKQAKRVAKFYVETQNTPKTPNRKTQEVLDRINKEKDKKYEEESSKLLRKTSNIPESWK